MSDLKYRRDLQVLRGLAVLAVVLFHARETSFPLGFLGVDVFFVISGFVVTPMIFRIFTEQPKSQGWPLTKLSNFYKSRFYRLAPALAVTLVVSVVPIFLFGPIDDHQRFVRQGIATLFLLGNFGAYRYSGDYFSPNPNPIIHTWSLSIEEQIYIFLPIILMFILHKRIRLERITAVVLGAISVLSFLSFLFPTLLQPLYSRAGFELVSQIRFYSPIDRIWQFTVGGLAFLLLNRFEKFIRDIPKSVHFLTAISLVAILFSPAQVNPQIGSIIASFLAVVIILFKSLDLIPNMLIQKLTWVGDRSYSIYLVHMPLMYLAKYSPVTQIGNGENRRVQTIIALLATFLLGALSYSKIENRFRGKSKASPGNINSISALIVLSLLLPLMLFVLMDQGHKHRYWGLNRNIQQPTYPGALDPQCERDSETGPPCVYATIGASKTILLIGDSHAGHISQAVIDASQSAKWNAVIWTHSSCRVQFQRSIPEQVSDSCLDINISMRKWVEEKRPDAIIVSQFVRADSSQDDLRDALATLRSMVPNVLLIENNPVFPDKRDFMMERPIVMSPYKPPKSYKNSQMQTVDEKASNTLAKWARRNGLFTMSFDSLFCKSGVCSRYSNKGWLYQDVDHFSVVGAELTIPQISEFLNGI